MPKYPLPIYGVVAWNRLVHFLSSLTGTAWARFALSLHGCKAGKGLLVDGRLIVSSQVWSGIEIGPHCTIYARPGVNLVGLSQPAILHCWRTGKITIGANVGMSSPVLSSRASITLGDRVNLGGNVRIYDHDFHSLDPDYRRSPALDQANVQSEPVVVGDDVFVGANAIILKGVHIGSGCIIGAGSVVTLRDIPSGAVVAGNPARIIRQTSATS